MKKLSILILLVCLACGSLHSQALKVTNNKEIQIGKGDLPCVLNPYAMPLNGILSNGIAHKLTFGDGERFGNTFKTDWNWGIQYAGGLSFIHNSYLGGPMAGVTYQHNHSRVLFLSNNRRVGINNIINPQYPLDVNGVIHAYNVVTSSDKRLKKDITPLLTNIYDLNKLNSITYKRNYLEFEQAQASEQDTNTHYGFIAQELREIYPELVFEDEQGYLSVNYIGMIPVLVNAIKELNSKVEVLESNNKELLRGAVQATTTSAVLYQNNPNPFDTQTSIQYYVPSVAVSATLCVYDLTGSQILKMDILGRETGSIVIDANQLKAGMYLYTLLVDGKEVDTKKMILTGE